MIRVSIGFLAGAVGFGIIAGAAIGTQAEAQGLVTIQKLSAPLANELVGEAVANCAQKGLCGDGSCGRSRRRSPGHPAGQWRADPYVGQRIL